MMWSPSCPLPNPVGFFLRTRQKGQLLEDGTPNLEAKHHLSVLLTQGPEVPELFYDVAG